MLLPPAWPAPPSVMAFSSTRLPPEGVLGHSRGSYGQFNLGDHVDDDPEAVAANRRGLISCLSGLSDIAWLRQVHSTRVVEVAQPLALSAAEADAAVTSVPGIACGALTADCLPVLFCRRDGQRVGAAHAGWRGLCQGILINTLSALDGPAKDWLAWVGPGISQRHFEVGAEVREAFLSTFTGPSPTEIAGFFAVSPTRPGHYYADLAGLALAQLQASGLGWVGASDHCTFSEPELFYSYRREPQCGRQLSLIYIKP